MERIGRLLFDHPLMKAVGLGLFGLLGNILSGAYIFEITKTVDGVQGLDWTATPRSLSFWLLLVVLLLMGLYGWGAARHEGRIRRALSETDVLGIALRELIGPMIEAAKRDIEDGKLRTLDDVRRMFGPGTGDRQS
ncbi:hypothetical protein Q8W71_25245 [Methylobacterium sp. NEAU 140]|uniref:hypothetical protein n=1 Tax=Methylobacterium sp. NEAU 140 TaxID=3064945 RepID=UPI0027370C20|nr:hypothetical protein [Methylobacterium sp. NEAU 140]MDP4025943.1 hypothetical protein [Methylobacterium sp. NEAU 140]